MDGSVARSDGLAGSRGSRGLLRDLNVSLLIELARRLGPISRADLARQSQLGPPTVSAIVAILLERGIFSEVAVGRSSGGRPPILLQLNPKAGYVVGVKLRGDGLTTVVCDLETKVVATNELSASVVGDPGVAIAAIEEATRSVLRQAGVPRTKVLGVGVGLAGVIDSNRGTCRFSHLLQWNDIDVAGPLRKRLRLPIWVENDVRTLAVAEKWVGDGLEARDFAVLSVGRGIGLGIIVDRSLYRGASGGAGEFGHVVIDPNGPPCECGRSGCLEALVGERTLCRRLGERLGREVSREELVELANAGDRVAARVLQEAGEVLGTAVANVVTLLNPELLIVSGEGTQLGPAFLEPLLKAVAEQTFAGLGREVAVKVQEWGDDAWAVGAATLVLRESLSLPGPDEDRSAIWHRAQRKKSSVRQEA